MLEAAWHGSCMQVQVIDDRYRAIVNVYYDTCHRHVSSLTTYSVKNLRYVHYRRRAMLLQGQKRRIYPFMVRSKLRIPCSAKRLPESGAQE